MLTKPVIELFFYKKKCGKTGKILCRPVRFQLMYLISGKNRKILCEPVRFQLMYLKTGRMTHVAPACPHSHAYTYCKTPTVHTVKER